MARILLTHAAEARAHYYGEEALARVHERGLQPAATLVRRSTLEDVFLRLTGRTLVD